METRNYFRLYVILISTLILSNSCKKINDTPNILIKDADSNIYETVTIGTQVWMKENLRTTRYWNGDLIGTSSSPTANIYREFMPKYQWASNGDEDNAESYGRLYTWFAITDSRNVCPAGWHIPTEPEWNILGTYLGDQAGEKMKETGTTHWLSPNTGANNKSGFTAIPSGARTLDGRFLFFGSESHWWTSTEFVDTTEAKHIFIGEEYGFSMSVTYKMNGFSVRCIKNN